MKKDAIEKKLNILLTIVIIICAIVCFSLCIQRIQGKDASIFGFRIYHILTGSMEPTIQTGTNVVVKEIDPEKLKVGDIITFISRDNNIYGYANTHRIIDIGYDESGNKYFVTKGDANSMADGVVVYGQDVRGKVIFHIKTSGFTTFYKFLCTPYGFVFAVVFPLGLVCALITKDFKNEIEQMRIENIRKEMEEEERKKG